MSFSINSVAIIGAKGGMGRLYTARSRAAGLDVVELGRPLTDEALAAAAARVDCVALSIPVKAMEEVSRRVGALLRGRRVLVELCSVKVRPVLEMCAACAGPVVGTHPLFGPAPAEDDEGRVALMPGREGNAADEEALEAVWAWTERMGFKPFRTTPDEHDKAMGYFQGLNFVTTVAYLAMHAGDETLKPFMTPSFSRRLAAAKTLLLEDAELFGALFETNPHSQDIVRTYRNYLNVAAGGDLDLLVQRAERWWTAKKKD